MIPIFILAAALGFQHDNVKRVESHQLWDRPAKIETAMWAGVGIADLVNTCHLINTGNGYEAWLPVKSCGGLVALSVATVVGVEVGAWALHNKGHHKLERALRVLPIIGNSAGLARTLR